MSTNQAALVAVADAVVYQLGRANLGWNTSPVRSYADWDEKLEDMDELHLDVVPVGYDRSDAESRGYIDYDCSVDIGVRKRLPPSQQEHSGRLERYRVDCLVRLVQKIHETFVNVRLTRFPDATWKSTVIRSTYSRKHLRELRQFTGIVRVTFTVSAAITGYRP